MRSKHDSKELQQWTFAGLFWVSQTPVPQIHIRVLDDSTPKPDILTWDTHSFLSLAFEERTSIHFYQINVTLIRPVWKVWSTACFQIPSLHGSAVFFFSLSMYSDLTYPEMTKSGGILVALIAFFFFFFFSQWSVSDLYRLLWTWCRKTLRPCRFAVNFVIQLVWLLSVSCAAA